MYLYELCTGVSQSALTFGSATSYTFGGITPVAADEARAELLVQSWSLLQAGLPLLVSEVKRGGGWCCIGTRSRVVVSQDNPPADGGDEDGEDYRTRSGAKSRPCADDGEEHTEERRGASACESVDHIVEAHHRAAAVAWHAL